MATVHARCRLQGSVIGTADITVAIILIQDPSLKEGVYIELTFLVVLFAPVACWLLLVE
jgi:hypothetical protein